jgi:hypothetical protein
MFSEFSGMLASTVTKTMIHQGNPYAVLLAQNIDNTHFIPQTQEKFYRAENVLSKNKMSVTIDTVLLGSQKSNRVNQTSIIHGVSNSRSVSVQKFDMKDSASGGGDDGLPQRLAEKGVGLRHTKIVARETERLEGNVVELNDFATMVDQIGKFEHMNKCRKDNDRRKITGYPAIKFDMFQKQIADREEFMATSGSVKTELPGKGKVQRENRGIVNGIKTEKENVGIVEKKQGSLLAKTDKHNLHL